MYHPPRRPLSGHGDITITRRRFSQIVKALAGSRPKAPLSDYRGFGWLSEDNCSHPKAFLSDYRNIGWSPESDRINMLIFCCSVYPVKITLSAILFMYDQISIIIKQITKPCIYR